MEDASKRVRARYITVFATFLAFMGIGVVDPILPVIANSIGLLKWQVELLFTAYILTMAIMMIPSGIFANKFGDKRMMTIGLFVVTVFALLCGCSNGITGLSLFRAGWGLGNSMFFATTMTLLIALSDQVARAVGMYEAAIGLGMAGGPLIGGMLGNVSWRYPFYCTSMLIGIAFLLALLFVYEPKDLQKRKVSGVRELVHLIKFPPFLVSALSAMLYYYGFFVVLAYSPNVLADLSPVQIGFVFFGWGLCLAYGSAVLSHNLERKYAPKTLLPVGLMGYVVILLLLFLASKTWVIVALIIVSGLFSGLNNALFTSLVMDVSPFERSITSGAYNFVRWMGAALGPIASGYLGDVVSLHSPYLVASVLVCMGVLAVRLSPNRNHTSIQVEC
jgi:MFS transporter, ACDE family, multidrug resistance protein